MSPPTPETTSIIVLESGSSRIWNPTSKLPDASHVYAVETCSRSDGSAAHSPTKATSAPPNATNVVSVEIHPAVRREILTPASVIASAPASGESSRPSRRPDHPRSALAWSTSSGTRRRAIATMRPSPIATSAAATAITARAKI